MANQSNPTIHRGMQPLRVLTRVLGRQGNALY